MQIKINEPSATDRQIEEENKQDADFIYAPITDDTAQVEIQDVEHAAPTSAAAPAQEAVRYEERVAPTQQETDDAMDELDTSYDIDDDDDDDVSDEDITCTVEDLDNSIEQGVPQEKYDALNARYERLMAEWDNYRKRTSGELELARESANKNMMEAIIPTLDNFTLALEHSKTQDDPAVSGIVSGFDAIYRSLMTSLEREGLQVINPAVGEPFDMNEHQAVSRAQTEGMDTDTVAQVVQVGYKFKNKILRPAMIVVNM